MRSRPLDPPTLVDAGFPQAFESLSLPVLPDEESDWQLLTEDVTPCLFTGTGRPA